jgi:hypothetical protein
VPDPRIDAASEDVCGDPRKRDVDVLEPVGFGELRSGKSHVVCRVPVDRD